MHDDLHTPPSPPSPTAQTRQALSSLGFASSSSLSSTAASRRNSPSLTRTRSVTAVHTESGQVLTAFQYGEEEKLRDRELEMEQQQQQQGEGSGHHHHHHHHHHASTANNTPHRPPQRKHSKDAAERRRPTPKALSSFALRASAVLPVTASVNAFAAHTPLSSLTTSSTAACRTQGPRPSCDALTPTSQPHMPLAAFTALMGHSLSSHSNGISSNQSAVSPKMATTATSTTTTGEGEASNTIVTNTTSSPVAAATATAWLGGHSASAHLLSFCSPMSCSSHDAHSTSPALLPTVATHETSAKVDTSATPTGSGWRGEGVDGSRVGVRESAALAQHPPQPNKAREVKGHQEPRHGRRSQAGRRVSAPLQAAASAESSRQKGHHKKARGDVNEAKDCGIDLGCLDNNALADKEGIVNDGALLRRIDTHQPGERVVDAAVPAISARTWAQPRTAALAQRSSGGEWSTRLYPLAATGCGDDVSCVRSAPDAPVTLPPIVTSNMSDAVSAQRPPLSPPTSDTAGQTGVVLCSAAERRAFQRLERGVCGWSAPQWQPTVLLTSSAARPASAPVARRAALRRGRRAGAAAAAAAEEEEQELYAQALLETAAAMSLV